MQKVEKKVYKVKFPWYNNTMEPGKAILSNLPRTFDVETLVKFKYCFLHESPEKIAESLRLTPESTQAYINSLGLGRVEITDEVKEYIKEYTSTLLLVLNAKRIASLVIQDDLIANMEQQVLQSLSADLAWSDAQTQKQLLSAIIQLRKVQLETLKYLTETEEINKNNKIVPKWVIDIYNTTKKEQKNNNNAH